MFLIDGASSVLIRFKYKTILFIFTRKNIMNAEQQKQFKLEILWNVLKPVLRALVAILGEDVLVWISGKLDSINEDTDSQHTQDGDGHNCKPNEVWDPVQGRCVPNVG